MIPPVIHFIFFGFTDFEQIHYWAIRSALAVHQPERVILWYSQAPKNNRWWTDIAQRVELRQVDPPAEFVGVPLASYQYKADVLRLQILQEHGGIYLDIDVISLKPFGDLLRHECVLGIEDAGATSVSNAVILTQPGHPFISEWLRQTGDNLQDKEWAHHAVCLPRQILDSGTWSVHVEPRSSFMPFDFRDDWILRPGDRNRLANSYTIHLWETIWMDQLRGIKPDSVLAQLCEAYRAPLHIAVYTIAKNEAHQVEGWAASNGEADVRLVCDTGSSDDTVAQLRAQGVWTESIAVQPWRFDHARGTALNLLPADIDVCIWQDLDERLLPGWRAEIERHWRADTTTANHRYRNNDNPWQWHSKIHARHHCHWTGAVHETLCWSRPESTIWIPELYLDERQDVKPTRAGYLELLEKKIAEGDRNWRTLFFYANELGSQGRHVDSIRAREQAYDACDEGAVVQSYVARTTARGYAAIDDQAQADRWFQRAISHADERETWFAYAEWCYQRQDWDRCYVFIRRCLSITQKRDGFTQDPRAWSATVYDIAALAAYNLGLHRQALEWGQQALDMLPNDQRLQRNLEFYQEALA